MTQPRRFTTATLAPLPGLAALALLLAVSASAANRTNGACFLRSDVDSFNAPDEQTVYVRVGFKRIYRLDLMTRCLDLSFRQTIGLEHQSATPWVCSPLEATVVYNATGIPQRCPVKAMHKLTPAEVAALPKRDLP